MIYKVLIHILHPNLSGVLDWCSQPIRGSIRSKLIGPSNRRASIWKSAWSKWLWAHSMIFAQIIKVIIFLSSSVIGSDGDVIRKQPLEGVREPEHSFKRDFLFDKMFICSEFMRSDSELWWFIIYFLRWIFGIHFIDELRAISKSAEGAIKYVFSSNQKIRFKDGIILKMFLSFGFSNSIGWSPKRKFSQCWACFIRYITLVCYF